VTIRVFLVDDHQLVRRGIACVLEQDPELRVVGEARSGLDAVRVVDSVQPDLVLMDVVMPEMNGIEATRQLLARSANLRVVALSSYGDRRYVAGMLASGARGYVLKSSSTDELRDAVHAVMAGKSYLCTELDDRSASGPAVHGASVYGLLAPREREVLQLIAEGFTSSRIAIRLSLSLSTVETHRRNLMRKVNLHSVADLTRYAIREGLTTADT
jgi:DNA-binding NarL/FixJ family response regulator